MKAVRIAGTIASTLFVASTAFAQTGASMTVTGCLMGEEQYRKEHKLTKGSFGGAGLGNEFVLIEGNCGDNSGKAYRLTGKPERDLKPFIGHRIEVTGQWDHERDAKTAAGQTNATLPPEIKIASFHEAAVPAPASASAAPAPAPVPSAPQTVASNETRDDRSLPRTASNDPLIALVGGLALSLAFGLYVFRARLA
jgi:LPXTG-motif cell wall-anchored protein